MMNKLFRRRNSPRRNFRLTSGLFSGTEKGASLIETLVALALMGIIAVSFMGGLATSSKSRSIADEHVSARLIAESQMEDIKKQTYSFSYDTAQIPPGYEGYSSTVAIDNMRNGNIQKITVAVRHHNRTIVTLESYKVNR